MKKIALVGLGQIAFNQHLPVIKQSQEFDLVCSVSRTKQLEGVENYLSIGSAVEARPDIDAVVLCTPPYVRFEQAMDAISHGKHVLLEKPPALSEGQVAQLISAAKSAHVSLIGSYHANYAPMIDRAKKRLQDTKVLAGSIRWLEYFDDWHPNQDWIWEREGFGVFDAGINAYSILTLITAQKFQVVRSDLQFLSDCDAPVSANVVLSSEDEYLIHAEFDWRHQGKPIWEIELQTTAGNILIADGGAKLVVNNEVEFSRYSDQFAEYQGVYRHFLESILSRSIDCDIRPLRLALESIAAGSNNNQSRASQ